MIFHRSWIAVCLFPFVSTLASAQDVVHFWSFEGADPWNDRAGTAHGIVLGGTSMESVSGKDEIADTAVNFQAEVSGEIDYFPIDGANLYQPGNDAFSFSFWFRIPDDGTADPRGIFDFSGNGADGAQSLFIGTSNELAVRVDAVGTGFSLAKIFMSESDDWHFVAATYDPVDGLSVHLDGYGVDASAPAAGGSVPADSSSYLGAFNFNNTVRNNGLNGQLDDFAVYSGILTQIQIQALYDGTFSPLDITSTPDAPHKITRIEREDDVTTVYWTSSVGRLYSVWRSSNLQPNSWQQLVDDISGTGSELSFPDTTTDDFNFYRIDDDTPPSP